MHEQKTIIYAGFLRRFAAMLINRIFLTGVVFFIFSILTAIFVPPAVKQSPEEAESITFFWIIVYRCGDALRLALLRSV